MLKNYPKINFYIIGPGCPQWLKNYSKKDHSIKILGFVNDVREYIKESDICIAPLTMGSGTRLKILEYQAMAKPVVSTQVGAEGIDVTNNVNILIADSWNEFANKVCELLTDKTYAKFIGDNEKNLF
jgi:glycosyltransferase involved in cell wall biosynthesis